MGALGGLTSTLSRGIFELRRPGEGDLPGATLWRAGQIVVTLVIVGTNLIGVAAVLGIANFVVPLPPVAHPAHVREVNALVAAGYATAAIVLGVVVGARGLAPLKDWLVNDRQATVRETRTVLYAPLRLFGLQVSLWLLAALMFGLVNLAYSDAWRYGWRSSSPSPGW